MKWNEIEDIISDSKIRLNSIYILFGYNRDSGFSDVIEHHEALGENGAVKDVAKVWENVTTLCNYMFDDGAIDVNSDLLEIRQMANELYHEAMKHEATKQLFFPCHKVVQNIDKYFKRKGILVQPQQKPIAAPQQANDGNDGELTGNGNENAPEGSDNGSKYIELPLSMQTDDKRAEKVFTEVVNKGWLQVIDNQHGKWIGFAKTKDGKIKNYEQSLAWLIVEIYDPERKGIDNWLKFEEYFNISDLSKHWGNANTYCTRTNRKRGWQLDIDKLIKAALQ